MKNLLWKDYRLNRTFLISIAVAVAVIYLVGTVMEVAANWPQFPSANDWREMFGFYGILAQLLTICIAALMGGNSIACERSDRSANFLAYLPPTRLQILTSKFIVATCAIAAVWAWALVCLHLIAPQHEAEFAEAYGPLAPHWSGATCVLAFGVGWLASTFMEKPFAPIFLGLVSPVLVQLSLEILHTVLHVRVREFSGLSSAINAGIGMIAFVLGTAYYLRRVEP